MHQHRLQKEHKSGLLFYNLLTEILFENSMLAPAKYVVIYVHVKLTENFLKNISIMMMKMNYSHNKLQK